MCLCSSFSRCWFSSWRNRWHDFKASLQNRRSSTHCQDARLPKWKNENIQKPIFFAVWFVLLSLPPLLVVAQVLSKFHPEPITMILTSFVALYVSDEFFDYQRHHDESVAKVQPIFTVTYFSVIFFALGIAHQITEFSAEMPKYTLLTNEGLLIESTTLRPLGNQYLLHEVGSETWMLHRRDDVKRIELSLTLPRGTENKADIVPPGSNNKQDTDGDEEQTSSSSAPRPVYDKIETVEPN